MSSLRKCHGQIITMNLGDLYTCRIHCTCMGGYMSKEVVGSAYPGTIYDGSSMESLSFHGGSVNNFGRCFMEVLFLFFLL